MMNRQESLGDRYLFYQNHLRQVILPFSMKRAVDWEHGGYYSCFTNDGKQKVSNNKYMWSQGRFIWIFSKLSEMEDFSEEERKEFLAAARLGVDFVRKHGFLNDGRCVFLMDEEGGWLKASPDGDYAGSTFADCYVASGFAQYAKAAADKEMMDQAMEQYERIMGMYENHTFQTIPFYIPEGMKCHLTAMILCGMQRDYLLALESLGDVRADKVRSRYGMFCDEIMHHFRQDNHLVLEMIGEDNHPCERFLGQYVNIGHTMEGMWFILEWALENRDSQVIREIGETIKTTFAKGWDETYGGLYYYMGGNGGALNGAILNEKEAAVAAQMERDCQNKLWWVHTEALYALLLYGLTQEDRQALEQFQMLERYVFQTFPNQDVVQGEWIHLRKRDGSPADNEVGGRLPIKDPFHTIRNIVLIMELLRQ